MGAGGPQATLKVIAMKKSCLHARFFLSCCKLALPALLVFSLASPKATAQGTAFTYQGRLNDGSSPANGTYDIRAGLYTTNSGGSVIYGPIISSSVAVTNGLFTIPLDYGSVFDGTIYWMQIAVRTNGASSFTVLSPRQQLTPAPYAVFATTASNLSGTLPSADLSGTYSGAVTFNNGGDSFTGNGTGLTNVNAVSLNGLNASSFWQLGGNNASSGQFIGTTNNAAFDLYAGGVRAVRLILRSDASGIFSNAPNVIGGSSINQVSSGVVGGTIAGGGGSDAFGDFPNTTTANFGTVGGGFGNTAGNKWATVGGGYLNTASGENATVGGGNTDTASGDYAVVAGGFSNTAGAIGSFVGGGGYDGTTTAGNLVNSKAATIGGGLGNNIPGGAQYAFIGGGHLNTNSAPGTTVSGGELNAASGIGASVSGGEANTASGGDSSVGGGEANAAGGANATVSGGGFNTASGNFAVVGGGNLNSASDVTSTVGGGGLNTASASSATVAGGYNNTANAIGSFIGGGGYDGTTVLGNKAQSKAAAIGGGLGNNIKGGAEYAIIGGGAYNTNSGFAATIGGGYQNTASGLNATVGGGNLNTASGDNATVAGGLANIASGDYSFAAGANAHAADNGSFVWADDIIYDYSSSFANGFFVRCTGGARFVTAVDGSGNATAGVKLNSGDTSWSAISDRNAKKNFVPVDGEAVLEKLAVVPVQFWNYKWEADTNTPHIGPMAQDFKAIFYPGRDDKSISTLEFDGVELAAIQGLNQKLEEKEARRKELEARVRIQAAEITDLRRKLERLERMFNEKLCE